ncbi:sugar phosphate isomerase/epimerase family protein [Consotaella salsifontis]|uniref:Sugar phosphate isomerase/epimerase n=1 Tax=Consotaella salsifontis TaxID=1365950 RepID=A0A1T4MPH9_9HYPH|nr:sugar phosphate isomerase/epimerase [Consotaella salsifontis]SJZ68705.1 Sugar phosphate isomerase/epimerase [Consotaella salsifontis]
MPLTDSLSFQLYSARNDDTEKTLQMLAEAGYTNVETFGANYEDPSGFRALLDGHGLGAKSGHFALAMVEGEPQRVIDICRTLGIETVVVPFLPLEERPTDAAGWQAIGARLAALKPLYGKEGLGLAWHNHDFEFQALADGSYPIEHILGEEIDWEADVAWMERAGAYSENWLKHFSGRVVAVHVKDIAPEGEKADEDGWADVGTGTVDWDALWPIAVEAGARLMIAEHDKPADAARFARVSIAKMKALAGAGN